MRLWFSPLREPFSEISPENFRMKILRGVSEEREEVVAREAEDDADSAAGDHVAQEVHSEDDPGRGDEQCDGQQRSLQLRIKESDGNGDSERRDGVAGRK